MLPCESSVTYDAGLPPARTPQMPAVPTDDDADDEVDGDDPAGGVNHRRGGNES